MSDFLEPVYLNERMVLNSAAYLFQGVQLESDVNAETERKGAASLRATLPFLRWLGDSLGFKAAVSSSATEEVRSVRRHTVGAVHMAVLDELRSRQMIEECQPGQTQQILDCKKPYVLFPAILRPIDFYSLMSMFRTLTPLIAQVLKDFGDKLLSGPGPGPGSQRQPQQQRQITRSISPKHVDQYEKSIESLLEKLEGDYLTGQQLEMVLWTRDTPGIPFGIVDLDVSEVSPSVVRARLTGGEYVVVGKVVGRTRQGESLSLMQRTVLSPALDFLGKIVRLQPNVSAIQSYVNGLTQARPLVEAICSLEIPGPATRVVAVSVCI